MMGLLRWLKKAVTGVLVIAIISAVAFGAMAGVLWLSGTAIMPYLSAAVVILLLLMLGASVMGDDE